MAGRTCFNCGTSHGPLKRYYWNTRTLKGHIASSHHNLLCETCAKSLGAWQQTGKQELVDAIYAPPTSEELATFDDINKIIDSRTN